MLLSIQRFSSAADSERSGMTVGRSDLFSDHRSASTSRRPSSTCDMTLPGRALTLDVSSERSKVMSCETLITEAFGSPASDFAKRTLPGAAAKARLDVTTATMTVAMRLSLKGFDCTTTTGRRKPGPDPVAAGREAHHNSPRFIFNHAELCLRHGLFQVRTLHGIDRVQLIGNSLGAVP